MLRPKSSGRKVAKPEDRLKACASKKLIFDAHCHYFNYQQQTQGVKVLVDEMTNNGIGFAALSGCAFKKTWMQSSDPAPSHHLYDDGDLYYYSMTDAILHRDLEKAGPELASYFNFCACGFNLADAGAGIEAQDVVDHFPVTAFGELTLQSDDINNMTVKGGNWTYSDPSVKAILDVCAAHKPHPLPFIFVSDACSVTTKPYRGDFEYIGEIEMVCSHNRNVPCLWIGAGTSMRGNWDGYSDVVRALLAEHPNLYVSFTPELISGKYDGLSRPEAFKLAKELPHRIVLGTEARGVFAGEPERCFGQMTYADECKALVEFAELVEGECGDAIAASLRYRTAAQLFSMALPDDPNAAKVQIKLQRDSTTKEIISRARTRESEYVTEVIRSMSYGGGMLAQLRTLIKEDSQEDEGKRPAAEGKNLLSFFSREASVLTNADGSMCPPSRAAAKWPTIDCHLHLLDFLQKARANSSGTEAALKAMDGCDVKKAVIFGMPCCKKWCFYRPEQPLYYQDDNGPCYVYSYADQMVADAWLALEDEKRARFAPCFASFDPTDLAALSHVKRMYHKYPKMWRGIGEIMCRHDDLTNMLLGKEIPRVNHPALNLIYEFAITYDLPVLVHHNSDRVGDNDDNWEYVHELEDVLTRYPTLKFVWVHAGVSRRCSEPNHHAMIDRLCSTFDNLMVDISWVVWEDVICDAEGVVKEGWVDCIQKHHTKFFIGSDNVAQFFPVKDASINLLASNITKYYQLFNLLTPDAASNVAQQNAERLYFDSWQVPKTSGERRYQRNDAFYDTECLDPHEGVFVPMPTSMDWDGKY